MTPLSVLFLSLVLLLSACAAPQATVTLTPSPTWTPTPTATLTPQPTSTSRPSLTPSLTPTLPGPDSTRTPAPRAQCPQPIHPPPTITFSEHASDVSPQILKYLNTRGSAVGLQAALASLTLTINGQPLPAQSRVISQDVTGDQAPDEVVELLYPDPFLPKAKQGELFVFACNKGEYEMALHQGPYEGGYFEGLLAITNMNGDSVPELVSYHRIFLPTDVASRNFYIQEWNGTEFAYLTFLPGIGGGTGVITDTDANGTLELDVLGDVRSPNYGPGRGFHQIWAWNGRNFDLSGHLLRSTHLALRGCLRW